jgi:hypothetical protein
MLMNQTSQNYQEKGTTPFMKIKDASRITGLSMYYLRNGYKDSTVPCIKSGTVYFINVPRLLEKLNVAESEVV